MRTSLLLAAAVLAACTKGDPAKSGSMTTDSTAAPMAPAALTSAQVAGTWHGTSRQEGSDTLTDQWTMVSTSDSTGMLVFDDAKNDSIPYSMRLDGDSVVMTSSRPYAGRDGKGRFMYRQVGRLQGDRLVGQVTAMLADRPDSVVGRFTWEATSTP
ncbi:MAG: hypothetical protein IRY91_01540 [Gemmatimonadaceae bacterium]|nr:hypothetical protein [Gemmatimonadaceae bacterium]